MKTIFRIAQTELRLFFYSPIAWLILIIFAFQAGMAFCDTFSYQLQNKALGRGQIPFQTVILLLGDSGSFFKVLNPDLVICHLAPGTKMQMTLTIGKGRGYVPAEENAPAESEFGTLPIDSIFTPIKNVKYSIENYRVEQKTDYEKLNLEITTDGSIHPKEALKEAAKILIQHFMLFSDEKITVNMEDTNGAEEFDEDILHMRQLLKTKLSDQDLSVRALNCLKAADVDTVGDLVKLNRNDLLKFRNFGKKSLTELDELLTSLNLKFGMDVSIYKLDKD